MQKTLLLIKPDGVGRGLVGECLKRFEERGFSICGLKMVQPTREKVAGHYSGGQEWVTTLGQRTLEDMVKYGKDPLKEIGTADPHEAGKVVRDWLVDYVSSSAIVAIVVSGPDAVLMARKIVGHTIPQKADIGSIRGDYSIDSPIAASIEKRPVKNLIHASGNAEEAASEIMHWFSPDELCG